MKNLIHYGEFRELAAVLDTLRWNIKSPSWSQRIFSSSLLKNATISHLLKIVLPHVSIIAIAGLFVLTPLSTFVVGTLLVLGASVTLSALPRVLLCSDERKQKIAAKLHKIVALHPSTQEIVLPILSLLQHEVSDHVANQLDQAVNSILIYWEEDSNNVLVEITETPSVQHPEKQYLRL